jgi:hypothetical protein
MFAGHSCTHVGREGQCCELLFVSSACPVADILDVSSARHGKIVLKYDKARLRPLVDHVLDLTSPMLKWSVKVRWPPSTTRLEVPIPPVTT